MKATTFFTSVIAIGTALFGLYGCHAGGNSTGREYMPDMAHAISYETNLNTYYSYNHWGSDTAYEKTVQPRTIVNGTIARGFTSFFWSGGDMELLKRLKEGGYNMNGHVIYNYPAGDSGRTMAMAAITSNPFPATKSGVAKGKDLYNINCAICHGEKGDGNGYLWRDGDGPYPNKPANFMEAEIAGSSEGRYYHAIMHGKGVMGAYADKLSFEERWNVIHYIRSMQKPDYAIADDDAAAPAKEAVKGPANFDLAAAEALLKAGKAKDQTLTLDNLKFKSGSAEIDLAASKDLEDLFKLLSEDPKMTIALSGHTDNAVGSISNLTLSQQRADAVLKFLVAKGIAATRMTGKGFGDTKPLGDNKTAEGKAMNRRTEVTITAQ
jgi:outer membrane protein OmpA-like peptidoglycan-associated protein